jgi:hypothetical protein
MYHELRKRGTSSAGDRLDRWQESPSRGFGSRFLVRRVHPREYDLFA